MLGSKPLPCNSVPLSVGYGDVSRDSALLRVAFVWATPFPAFIYLVRFLMSFSFTRLGTTSVWAGGRWIVTLVQPYSPKLFPVKTTITGAKRLAGCAPPLVFF